MIVLCLICSSKKVDQSSERWENAQFSVDCLNKSSISDIESAVEYVFLIFHPFNCVTPLIYNSLTNCVGNILCYFSLTHLMTSLVIAFDRQSAHVNHTAFKEFGSVASSSVEELNAQTRDLQIAANSNFIPSPFI